MITQFIKKQPQKKHGEKGQALVIGTGILCCLAVALLFYLSIQRAYNLANFLDETAELAAQAGAEPIADDIVSGQVSVDGNKAEEKALATVAFASNSISGEIDPSLITGGAQVATINPGAVDSRCEPFNLNAGDENCYFPIVIVDLELPTKLFGVPFTIRSRGVATLGANSRQPETATVDLPTPTPLPPSPTLIITVP